MDDVSAFFHHTAAPFPTVSEQTIVFKTDSESAVDHIPADLKNAAFHVGQVLLGPAAGELSTDISQASQALNQGLAAD